MTTLLCTNSAQAQDDREAVGLLVLMTSTSMTPTTTSVIFVRIRQKNQIKRREEEVKEYQQYVMLDAYLQSNEADVEDAFAMGAGEVMRDLATILDIPQEEYASWAMTMRTRRRDAIAALQQPHETTFDQAIHLHHIMTAPTLAVAHAVNAHHTGGQTP